MSTTVPEETLSDEEQRAAVLAAIARQQQQAREQWQRDAAGRFRADPAKARSEALFEISKRADAKAREIRADYAKPEETQKYRGQDHLALLRRVESEAHAAMRQVHQLAVDTIEGEKRAIHERLFRAPTGGSKLLEVVHVTDRQTAHRLAVAAARIGDVGVLRALAAVGEGFGWDDAIYPVWRKVDPDAAALLDQVDELDNTLAGMSMPSPEAPSWRQRPLTVQDAKRAAEDAGRRAADALAGSVRGDLPAPDHGMVESDVRERLREQVAASLAKSGAGGDDFEE